MSQRAGGRKIRGLNFLGAVPSSWKTMLKSESKLRLFVIFAEIHSP